jgi:hypothetical protein
MGDTPKPPAGAAPLHPLVFLRVKPSGIERGERFAKN